jgi:hypothetical protein
MIYFKDLPVGTYFNCNGNLCRKASTRTGYLIHQKRTFYFSKLDLCEYVAEAAK